MSFDAKKTRQQMNCTTIILTIIFIVILIGA